MVDLDSSPPASKRRKTNPPRSRTSDTPLSSQALRTVKQAVYGKNPANRTDEFTIDGKPVRLTPRKPVPTVVTFADENAGAVDQSLLEGSTLQEPPSQDELNEQDVRLQDTPTKARSSGRSKGRGEPKGVVTADVHDYVDGPALEQEQTPSKKKRKRYKGYAYKDDLDEPSAPSVNNQDEFQKIVQTAAEEAIKADADAGGARSLKKTLRERHRGEPSGAESSASKPTVKKGSSKKHVPGRKAGRPKKTAATVADQGSEDNGDDNPGNEDVIMADASIDGLEDVFWSAPENDDQAQTKERSINQRKSTNLYLSKSSLSPPLRLPTPESPIGRPLREEPEFDNVDELKAFFEANPEHLTTLKTYLLDGLTAKRRLTLIKLDDEYEKVHQLLEQTVLAGEGNSMLVIGARGSGKTTLVETAISELASGNRDEFHVVRLNGFIHTDDKLALHEIWRQLGREMDVEDDIPGGRSNYADTLASLLALLSHQEEESEGEQPAVAKSVIFILDEFDLFASHPRQTLLYNLFDVAQSRNAPIAVLGLTTKINVVENLEKRVKSRFGQRYVHLSLPKTFAAFQEICLSALQYSPPLRSATISARLQSTSAKEAAGTIPTNITTAWNAHITTLLTHPILTTHLQKIYTTTKIPSTFFTSALLPISALIPTSPLPTPSCFSSSSPSSLSQSQTTTTNLLPPDSHLTLLPSLSTLSLSLLIAAARLSIILSTDTTTFSMVYEEYVSLASKTKLHASAAGQVAVGGGARVWGQGVAKEAWEGLAELELVLPAAGAGRAQRGEMWRVDVGLEEIGAWFEGEGRGVGGVGALSKWCREI